MKTDIKTLTYVIALLLMLGWLMKVGQSVVLPVIVAMIALYILSSATDAMGRIPVIGRLPTLVRRTLVLAGFTVFLVATVIYVVNTFTEVIAAIPSYENNLDGLIREMARIAGIEDEPTWSTFYDATVARFDLSSMIPGFLNSISGFGGTLFIVVLYAAFFMAERVKWESKLKLALGDEGRHHKTLEILDRINTRVGEYLSVKTVVNLILGAASYGIMLALGIEFALFWAILIALLNYVPYIGSLIGVIFPVLLSLAQFGSLGMSIVVLVALTAVQMFVAGVLEPRMMSRAFNLTPFVVLFALAFWSALWGLAGAVLAVPLTSTLAIVLAEIRSTRPIAIMLSGSGRI